MAEATPGLFTAAQGSRGAEVFGSRCGGCHIERQFSGSRFESSWRGRSLFEFFDFVRSAMPYDDPGSLSNDEYADIVAFVLQNNAYPSGNRELPARPDALSRLYFN